MYAVGVMVMLEAGLGLFRVSAKSSARERLMPRVGMSLRMRI